jgi:hypothetical protein
MYANSLATSAERQADTTVVRPVHTRKPHCSLATNCLLDPDVFARCFWTVIEENTFSEERTSLSRCCGCACSPRSQPPPGPARHPSRHIHCLSTCLIHPARVAAARAHARGTQPNNTHSTAKLKVAESPSTFCLFHFGCRFRRPSGPRTACFNSLWRHPAATRCVRFSLYHANIRYMITLHLVFIAECDSFRLLTVDNPQLCTRKA